jgi:SAM-dependent methyltransferase
MSENDLEVWQEFWRKFAFSKEDFTTQIGFAPFLTKYLNRVNDKKKLDLLDIGCFPGSFLYFFSKNLGYRVFGVDFLPQTANIPKWLMECGVEAYVTVADFFNFNPGRGYDVVTSFGFVEHFPNWEEVFDRHLALLNPGGLLVIGMPNYRYGHYCLRRLLNPSFLDNHYLEVMDPRKWEGAAKVRELEVLYAGYHGTFGTWGNLAGRGLVLIVRKIILRVCNYVQRTIDFLKIDYPNRFFSPYIFIVCRQSGSKRLKAT